MQNEMEPVNIARPDFWEKILDDLSENTDMVIPVYLESPKTGKHMGEFFLLYVEEKSKAFIQVEGFNNIKIEAAFILGALDLWKRVQPGIYRMELDEE